MVRLSMLKWIVMWLSNWREWGVKIIGKVNSVTSREDRDQTEQSNSRVLLLWHDKENIIQRIGHAENFKVFVFLSGDAGACIETQVFLSWGLEFEVCSILHKRVSEWLLVCCFRFLMYLFSFHLSSIWKKKIVLVYFVCMPCLLFCLILVFTCILVLSVSNFNTSVWHGNLPGMLSEGCFLRSSLSNQERMNLFVVLWIEILRSYQLWEKSSVVKWTLK